MIKFIFRLINYKIKGKGNSIETIGSSYIKGIKIDIKGNNNKVIIEAPQKFENVKLIIRGNNNQFTIKKSHYHIKNTTFFMDMKSCNRIVSIDENFMCIGADIITALDNSKLTIGKNCMFSYGIHIRNHDGHTIYQLDTKESLHKNSNIVIEDKVWLGFGTTLIKGCNIKQGVIVGAKSVITKDLEQENSIYAGIPARLIKTNVGWTHENTDIYNKMKE